MGGIQGFFLAKGYTHGTCIQSYWNKQRNATQGSGFGLASGVNFAFWEIGKSEKATCRLFRLSYHDEYFDTRQDFEG